MRSLEFGSWCVVAAAGVVALVGATCCGGHAHAAPTSARSVRELAFEMRVDDFARREKAGAELRAIGAKAVPQLVELLHASDSSMTSFAAKLGAEELTVPAHDWHAYAASALGELGPEAIDAVPDLEAAAREVLTTVSPQYRDLVTTRAHAALIRIRREPLEQLERALADPHSAGWNESLEVAKELGTSGRPLVPALIASLRIQDGFERARVVDALARIDGANAASMAALLRALDDGEPIVRSFALRALRNAPAPSAELIEAVAARLGDPQRSVRQQAIETLLALDGATHPLECSKRLEPLLKDSAAEVSGLARVRIDDLRAK